MASLLSWLGQKIGNIPQDIHNDVVQPFQRDVLQPVQRANNTNFGQLLRPAVNRVANLPIVHPLLQADQATFNTAKNVGMILPNELKTLADIAARNPIAARNAFNQAGQGLQTAVNTAQSVPRGIAQLEQSVRPGGIRQPIVPTNPISKAILGNNPVNSIQSEYSANRNAGVSKANALTGSALSGIGDVSSLLGATKGVTELPKVASTVADIPAHATPILHNQSGSLSAGQNAAALSKQEVANLKKQGFDDVTIAKMQGANGEKVATTPDVPTAEPKPKSTYVAPLPPAETLGATVKTLGNKVTVLRKIDTPSSHALADHIQAIDNLGQDLRANAKNRMPTVFGLNEDQFVNLGNVIEHGAKPIDTQVAAAVKEAKPVLKDIHSSYTKTGGKTGYTQGYFPRDYSALKVGSPEYNTALQDLIRRGKAKDLTEATGMLRGYASGKGTTPSFFGNFDRKRLDVPGYTYTKDSLQKYLNGAAQKTAEATHFGPKGKIADELLANVAKEGGDASLASKSVQNYLHNAGAGKSDPLAGTRGFFSAARLGKAPISHLGQTSNVGLVTRVSDLAAGWEKYLTRNKEALKTVNESDVNNPSNIHGLAQQETSVKGVMHKVTAAGLEPVMKMNRSVSAIAGERYGNWLAGKGNIEELRKLGVTGDVGKTLTREQQLQAARGVTNQTMFSPSRAQTPVSAETPTGKTIGQYRTAYGYKQTGLIYDKVLKAAANGDLKPLGKFLALSAPVAGATIATKNALSGKKEGPGGIALDAAGALGGIPGELALQAARYGKGNVLKTAASAIAPVGGELVSIGQAAQEAIKGKYGGHNLKPAEKYGVGLIPVAGSFANSKLFPPTVPVKANPNAGVATNPSSPQTKADAKAEKADFEKKAGDGYGLQQLSNGKFVTNINGTVAEHNTLKLAQKAIAEDTFKNSDQNIKVIGDKVYRKAADGSVSITSKTKYDYQLGTATLTSQKNAGNLGGYLKTAASQLQSITKQLQDPNIDPLDAQTLQNQASTLQSNIAKYKSYGGFTKPKAARSTRNGTGGSRAKAVTSFNVAKSASSIKRPAGVKVSTPKFSAPKTRKLSVSKIPKVSVKISSRKQK